MQAELTNVTPIGNTVYPLSPTIDFTCHLRGRKLKASITHQEDNYYQPIYRLSFSDGHTGTFFASDESEEWFEAGRNVSEYASAIKEDLEAICMFNRSNPPFCITVSNNNKVLNVWVVPDSEDNGKYAVHYKGDFRFYVHKTADGFSTDTVERHSGFVNEEIAVFVIAGIKAAATKLSKESSGAR